MKLLALPLLLVAIWASVRLPGLAVSAFAPPKDTSSPQAKAQLPRARVVAKAENPPQPSSGSSEGPTLHGSLLRPAGHFQGWVRLQPGTPLSPGDTLLVPTESSLSLRYVADSAEVSIPGGGMYVVGNDPGLMKAFPRVFYHESEQASLATKKETASRIPTLARAIWLSQGKPPPPGASEANSFRARIPTRPIVVVHPEGDVILEAEIFPVRQEIRLEETPAGLLTLTGLLFGDEEGANPIWSESFGSSPTVEVPIPRPGNYTFLAVSEDQARVSRRIRLVALRTEPLP